MFVSYFSPLAPAAVLLLSAFILYIVIPALPEQWQQQPALKYINAPVLVGVALATLLGLRYTPGIDPLGEGLDWLSGWSFGVSRSVAALAVRADSLSLPFLVTALLILLGAVLLSADLNDPHPHPEPGQPSRSASELLLGAVACILFVAANGLTVVHAALLFDGVTALVWLARGQKNVAVARLFLGITTAAGLLLATALTAQQVPIDQFLLGGIFWLRLGLFPLIEIARSQAWSYDERLAYQALTMMAGLYLVVRVINQPLPAMIHWLTVGSMLLIGAWVWLLGKEPASFQHEATPGPRPQLRLVLLHLLILGQSLLVLLAAPLSIETAAALAVGLGLSYVALWVTPALGPPKFSEGAWSWPYLPAATATLSLVGVPFSLGWPIRVAIFDMVNQSGGISLAVGLVAAEGLLFSSIVYYWRLLLRGSDTSVRRSVVGIVAMVPFLTPGLAYFILSALTQLDLWAVTWASGWWALTYVVIISVLAVGAGSFRPHFILAANGVADDVADDGFKVAGLEKMLRWLATFADAFGRFILRVQVTLEGQHYLGWAFFVALVGTLIILLS